MIAFRESHRIVDDGGPIVIWGEWGTGRVGLAVRTSANDNPRSRTVTLEVSRIGRWTTVIPEPRGVGAPCISAKFDVDEGRIVDEVGRPPEERGLLSLLMRGRQKSLAEIFRRRWRQAKGLDDHAAWKGRDWSWWEPGLLVPYCEVFPDGRDFLFADRGKTYFAQDFHCVNPECDCDDLVTSFHEVHDAQPTGLLGSVKVDCRQLRVVEATPGSAPGRELRRLWSVFRGQHGLQKSIRRRRCEMKSAGYDVAERARVARSAKGPDLPLDELVRRLKFIERPFPRHLLEQAVRMREEITPRLLGILEDTIAHAEEIAGDTEYYGHFYALYLLAQFREPRAYPLVARLASLPARIVGFLLGEFVNYGFPRVLASVAHGDPGPVMELMADRTVYSFIRAECPRSVAIMVHAGELDRDRAIALYRQRFQTIIRDTREGRPEKDEVATFLVECACDLYPEELVAEIEEVTELGLLWMQDNGVQQALAHGKDAVLRESARRNRLITDAIEELQGDGWFEEEPGSDSQGGRRLEEYWGLSALQYKDEPQGDAIRRDTSKVGRNEPCPCGSGKKYKRCCLKG